MSDKQHSIFDQNLYLDMLKAEQSYEPTHRGVGDAVPLNELPVAIQDILKKSEKIGLSVRFWVDPLRKEITFGVRGTDDLKDLQADWQMMRGKPAAQLNAVMGLYAAFKAWQGKSEQYEHYHRGSVGHSLGGGFVQVLGSLDPELKVRTADPLGAGKVLKSEAFKQMAHKHGFNPDQVGTFKNIVNIVPEDSTVAKMGENIGEVHSIPH